jgi:hypothetical protein
MSPLHEAVRGLDLWGYEASLPDADPVFQSSCCGNSYCKKTWLDITMASFSEKLHTNTARMYSGIINGTEWTGSIQYAPIRRVRVAGMSLVLRRSSCRRDKAAHHSARLTRSTRASDILYDIAEQERTSWHRTPKSKGRQNRTFLPGPITCKASARANGKSKH